MIVPTLVDTRCAVSGESVIGVRPTPHIMDNDIAAYIGQQVTSCGGAG